MAVPVAVGMLLLLQQGATLRQRAGRVAVFSLPVALPMALWLLRNYLAVGSLIQNRRPVDYSLPALLWDIVRVIGSWSVSFDLPLIRWPSWEFLAPERIAFALLALAVAALIPLAGFSLDNNGKREHNGKRGPGWTGDPVGFLAALH